MFGLFKEKKDNLVIKEQHILKEMTPYIEGEIIKKVSKSHLRMNRNTLLTENPYTVDELGIKFWIDANNKKENDEVTVWNMVSMEIINDKKFIDFAVKYLNFERVSDDPVECLMHWKMKE